MKATVTSATEVTWDGQQTIQFDVVEGDQVLISHSVTGDVDQIADTVKDFLRDYKKKANSKKRIKVGDNWEV